jgi:RimJ/RimL family protein N-acetyltransferase
MIVRRLGVEDRGALEAFLHANSDSSLFLRSNLAAAGVVDRGEPMHATYVGAFEDGTLRAVAAHCWNGNLLLQAPAHLDAVARAAIEASRRELTGILGPWDQTCTARRALAPDRATRLESHDGLFALDLGALVRPPGLDAPGTRCRATRAADLDLAVEWRAAYEVELLGALPGAAHRARVRADVERQHAAGSAFLLEDAGIPVATSAFNARLADVVQVGGVYTPPALRNRGHARAVVAGSLAAVAQTGVARAILFTGEDNPAARRAYAAIGFRRVGDYGLVLF